MAAPAVVVDLAVVAVVARAAVAVVQVVDVVVQVPDVVDLVAVRRAAVVVAPGVKVDRGRAVMAAAAMVAVVRRRSASRATWSKT